ncbi:unnamed protein product, partial [Ectocarpus sp. 12 AP-2014]
GASGSGYDAGPVDSRYDNGRNGASGGESYGATGGDAYQTGGTYAQDASSRTPQGSLYGSQQQQQQRQGYDAHGKTGAGGRPQSGDAGTKGGGGYADNNGGGDYNSSAAAGGGGQYRGGYADQQS